jgi:hypothetical protein
LGRELNSVPLPLVTGSPIKDGDFPHCPFTERTPSILIIGYIIGWYSRMSKYKKHADNDLNENPELHGA